MSLSWTFFQKKSLKFLSLLSVMSFGLMALSIQGDTKHYLLSPLTMWKYKKQHFPWEPSALVLFKTVFQALQGLFSNWSNKGYNFVLCLLMHKAVFNWVPLNQSQKAQTIQWINQNSFQIHVADAKRGKTSARESRLVLVSLLFGWQSGASIILSQSQSLVRRAQNQSHWEFHLSTLEWKKKAIYK